MSNRSRIAIVGSNHTRNLFKEILSTDDSEFIELIETIKKLEKSSDLTEKSFLQIYNKQEKSGK